MSEPRDTKSAALEKDGTALISGDIEMSLYREIPQHSRSAVELSPESLVLCVCVSTLDTEVELDLRLCT